MTEPYGTLRSQELRSVPPPGLPVLGLLLATLAWAGSFTWAKAAGDEVNQAAGLASGALLGPMGLGAVGPGHRLDDLSDWEGCSGPDKRYKCWVWIAPAKR